MRNTKTAAAIREIDLQDEIYYYLKDLKEKQEQQRKEARREQGRCQSYEELYELAKKRGYKNPSGWAYFIMRGRKQ